MNLPEHPPSPNPGASPDTWLRAKALFGDVVTLPANERAGMLDARCGDDAQLRQFVESLLRSSDALPTGHSESLQSGLGAALSRAVRQALPEIERGRRFGAFAVIEEIGRGGMGIVYLAERHDGTVAQRVALKLVAAGMLHGEAAQRLARERRLLAALEHPHIARLIDAGEDASGIPYFAMEYVQGAPITAYCDRQNLPLAQRLRLFRQVCAAVQYAHANLIAHCDIKPGNILVTDSGLPKLLDFGIATTLDAARADGETDAPRFFSPQAAAPEQFLGQPSSIATDIYALGVLLCELCGGSRPFASTDDRDELRRRVLHEAPALPSSAATAKAAQQRGTTLPALRRQLAGDIDAIVGKTLAKSPHERYASVEQLDADIARHLEKHPVQARAGERGYRFSRFLQRHALAVVFAAAVAGFVIVLAGLLASFAASTAQQNEQLAHERDQARQREQQAQFERARAQQVTDFVIGLFKDAAPGKARAPDISARELLKRGGEKLHNSLGDQPQLKAAMLAAIGEAHLALDNVDAAEAAVREAFALRGALRPALPRDLIDSLMQLGTLANRSSRYAETLALVNQAQALALANPDAVDPVALINIRATALQSMGMQAETVLVRREALALEQRAHAAGDLRIMRAAVGLSDALYVRGIVDEAEQVLLENLPQEPGANADGPESGEILLNLAKLARDRQDYKRASELISRALPIYRKVYGDNSMPTSSVMAVAAMIAHYNGDNAQALQLFQDSLRIKRDLGGENAMTAISEQNVGALLHRMKRPAEALAYFQRAVALGEKLYTPGHGNLSQFRLSLGKALRDLGRYAAAEPVLRTALQDFEKINAPRGINVATTRGELACIALARGDKSAGAVLSASVTLLDRYPQESTAAERLRECAARSGLTLVKE
jgi:eukaryotic-like serine/threonine-protein kinase